MPFLLSLAFGLAVGAAYGLSGVRSPAPPLVALFGLLGILAGEQSVSWLKARAAASRPSSQVTVVGGSHAPGRDDANDERRPGT